MLVTHRLSGLKALAEVRHGAARSRSEALLDRGFAELARLVHWNADTRRLSDFLIEPKHQ
ncbi:hypothetical protein QCE63_22645 [Caballeronia sp. LZ065]|uniref:hypothetical protein n=1 Tax=Caballeronia sp. LZ065 TaxID=3038571 RepID=UPI0028660C70|nr:hypothetical protein [Caballeronia sp. LZ065]MDR5782205.1 hypothetical protein [Caballeronia sp. LZ065]